METKKLLMAIFAIIAFTTCTEQETNPAESLDSFTIAKKNWQERTLTSSFFENQGKISHYSFSKEDIERALAVADLSKFHFVLGLQNDQLLITMIGINSDGKEVVSINSIPNFNSDMHAASLKSLQNNPFQYSKARLDAPVIGKHLLPYNTTFDYIQNWNRALISQDIEELITHEGIRFRHYSLEKEVIADIISDENAEGVALFLGLNADEKLTTVLLKKDELDYLIINSNQRNGGGSYDFTDPCPNTCD